MTVYVPDSNGSFTADAGDDITLNVSVVTLNGTPKDLTGATAIEYFIAKSKCSAPIYTKTLGDGVSAPSANTFTIELTSIETDELCGVYYHECTVTDAAGKKAKVFKSTNVVFE